MAGTLANDIEAYAEALDFVMCYTEAVEVTTLFSLRDGIALDLREGAHIDEDHRRLLREADDRLLASAPALARRFREFNFAASIRELVDRPLPEAGEAQRSA